MSAFDRMTFESIRCSFCSRTARDEFDAELHYYETHADPDVGRRWFDLTVAQLNALIEGGR